MKSTSSTPVSITTETDLLLLETIDNFDGYVICTSRDGSLIFSNAKFQTAIKKCFGIDLQPGERNTELLEKLDTSLLKKWKALTEATLEGSSQNTKHEFKVNEHLQIIDLKLVPIRNATGKVIAISCYAQDITQKTIQERQISQIETRFRALIENSLDGIVLINKKNKISYASPSVMRVLGYAPDDLIGNEALTIAHPEDWTKVSDLIRQMKTEYGQTKKMDFRFRTKDGEWRWVNARITNMLHEPTIEAIVINYSDVSEIILAEQRLTDSEELYRSLFNNSPVSIWVCDLPSLKYIEVNQTALNHYGYTREEFLNMYPSDIRLAGDIDDIEEVKRKGLNAEVSNLYPQHVKKNGELISVEVAIHEISFRGKPAYLVIAHDISETLQLEHALGEERVNRQIEITKATIEGQEKLRSEMGKELHDNINQMLATVKLYLDTYRTHRNDQLLQRSEQIINDTILEIRKLSQSLVPPTLGDMTLVDSLHELVSSARISGKDIRLSTDELHENQLSEPLKISIFRIVQEQMNNIMKYSKAKNVVISIEHKLHSLDLEILDDGVGFDINQRKKGIGLRNIVNRANTFNGKVEIDTAPGRGCRIHIVFKLEEEKK